MPENDMQASRKAKAKNRPKNLNLLTIRLPINALVSILHRATGCALFLVLPFMLLLLQLSLSSAANFEAVVSILNSPFSKLIMVGFAWAFFSPFFCWRKTFSDGCALDDHANESALYQQDCIGFRCVGYFSIGG